MKQVTEGKTEYRTRISFVWNYEKDEAWLTELSAQGLHLVRPGLFRNRFETDVNQRYVYKLDYHQLKSRKELDAYLVLFEDLGWEHTSSFLGWHYFRKPYVEGQSYNIYTDRTSLIHLWKRVQLMLFGIALANIPMLVLNLMNLFRYERASEIISSVIFSVTILQAVVLLLLLYGCLRFQNKMKRLTACPK
ncbi:DUF2812 domain-containing protein [Paenibacillus xylaniclasticus]|uniref:DUF2812 domain-containing protein n=1 Tax=Paenibacillus xylaniclasticus TaxID=588083 RepID=UPI000FDA6312|nr:MULTISPECIES: DUF2812 domain-containing protein [Paenibacillus]GFN32175.1 hypothetical protein PCURB6_24350 [Paenibacillus curdlanolyticus]